MGILALLFANPILAPVLGAAAPARQPNVVLIFVDDMNYEGPSCYGGRWGLETPNIDRLAAEGVRCTSAYVSAPTCSPSRRDSSRAAINAVSGTNSIRRAKRESACRCRRRRSAIGCKPWAITRASLANGILAATRTAEEYHPLKRGFDEFYGFYGSMVCFFRSEHIFRGTQQVKDPKYLTDQIARETCDFIRRNQVKPFFLYASFNAVHTPLEAAEEDLEAISSLDFSRFRTRRRHDCVLRCCAGLTGP